jgi:alanyl-tRNA synthetase
VNEQIRHNTETHVRVTTPDLAIEEGAMALFGEKYGEEVRVVSMGANKFSVELCGGTHVNALGDIGLFKITSESSVSAGVRRIEAITSFGVLDALYEAESALTAEREQSRKAILDLQKANADLKRNLMFKSDNAADASSNIIHIGPYKASVRHLNGAAAKDLKSLADQMKTDIQSGIAVITNVDDDGKVSLVIGVTSDLTKSISAVDLVQKGAAHLGGKGGGGRPDLAQAGGSNPEAIKTLIKALE